MRLTREYLKCGSLLLLLLFGTSLPGTAFAAAVQVPAGTPIVLTFDTALNPKTARQGDVVFLSVSGDVAVGGKVVVANGAKARGEIIRSKKRGSLGKPDEIAILVRSVPGVDGTVIPLAGNTSIEGDSKETTAILVAILCCILGLMIKGERAEIAQGTNVQATVLSAIQVIVPN